MGGLRFVLRVLAPVVILEAVVAVVVAFAAVLHWTGREQAPSAPKGGRVLGRFFPGVPGLLRRADALLADGLLQQGVSPG